MSGTVNIPSPDNYDSWDAWARATVRALSALMTSLGIVEDVGKIVSFPNGVTPDGYLRCNGQALNKQTFPALAQLLLPATTVPSLASPYGAGYSVWIKAA